MVSKRRKGLNHMTKVRGLAGLKNRQATNNNYEEFIGNEILEVMRNMFPLSNKREDTFIAGLSMGGYGAIRTGMKYAQNYSCIIGLSSALPIIDTDFQSLVGENEVFGNLEQARKTDKNYLIAYNNLKKRVKANEFTMPKFYLACGTKDSLITSTRSFRDLLQNDGVSVTYDEENFGHEWDFWDSQIKKVINWLPLDDSDNGLNSGHVAK